LQYVSKRLIRGLSSSRAGARQGFALAFTEVLAAAPSLKTSEMVKLIDQELQPEGSMSKQVSCIAHSVLYLTSV